MKFVAEKDSNGNSPNDIIDTSGDRPSFDSDTNSNVEFLNIDDFSIFGKDFFIPVHFCYPYHLYLY
jgi:hypothetical protein